MRVVLDENLPFGLVRLLDPHDATTVQQEGHSGIDNGELLKLLERRFDVFITADKNLRYQQNLQGRHLALIELPTNRWPVLQLLIPRIRAAIDRVQPGSYTIIESTSGGT
jgi:hypothetical protein